MTVISHTHKGLEMSFAPHQQVSATEQADQEARHRLLPLPGAAVVNDLTSIAKQYGIYQRRYIGGYNTFRAFVYSAAPTEEVPNPKQQWIGNEEKHLHRAVSDIDAHYRQQIQAEETFRVTPRGRFN
jgi:hypothetical protein